MRRLVFMLAAVLVALGATGGPAVAADVGSFNRQVSGPFTGTSVFDFSHPVCSFVHQVYDATFTTRRKHPGAFHLDGCSTIDSTSFTFEGTFTMTTSDRARVEGTVSGTLGDPASPGSCTKPGDFPTSLDFTLTLTHATKKLRHAMGTIHLSGSWCSPATPNVQGAISGTLAGALTRAHSST